MNILNITSIAETLLFLTTVPNTSNNTALESKANFTIIRTDYTPLLTCIDEIQGVLEGVEYNQPSRIVDCGRQVKFCQKITAHYISAKSESQIAMRGCDSIQIAGQFDGVSCEVYDYACV
ncbi:hypothetical protein COOONC_08205 [Cooperia oncophora]